MAYEWVRMMLGGWILLSPWVLGASENPLMLWSNALVGLALVIASVWTIFGRESGGK